MQIVLQYNVNMIFNLYALLVFIFGLIIGSFLNVVIYRYNTGLPISRGRSRCFSCSRDLTTVDLVPVFSFLWFRGKCRTCKARISWQYPLVELMTAVLFTAIYMHNTLSPMWLIAVDMIIASLFICIAVYDFRHKIIPDGLVYTAAVIAVIRLLLAFSTHLAIVPSTNIWTALVAGPLIALPFALLWLVSGGRWMGLGDAKLALPIGWMLGIAYGFTAIVYSFWIGTAVIILCMLFGEAIEAFSTKDNALKIQIFRGRFGAYLRRKFPSFGLRTEIPFGPFMIIGLYLVYFTAKCLFCLHF